MILFIEGLPGSGKSTFTKKLTQYLTVNNLTVSFFNEGDLHPIDLAWCSVTDVETYNKLLQKYESYRTQIESLSKQYNDQMITAYTKIQVNPEDRELYDDFGSYEIYRTTDFNHFKQTHIDLWSSFQEETDVTIFECVFLQNHINELILKFDCTQDKINTYFDELWNSLHADKHLFYIKQERIAKTIQFIAEERVSKDGSFPNWIDLVMEYFENTIHAKDKGYLGYDGAISYFLDRQKIELDYLSLHPTTSTIISLEDDYDQAFQQLIDSHTIKQLLLAT